MVAKDGSTHYFEYGRYAGPEGIVRNAGPNNTPTPSVERDASGKITPESMKNLLQTLSDSSGKHGAVEAAVIDTSEIEDTIMEAYLEARQAQNSDPNRQHYSLFGGHNCGTLVCDALSAAGHRAPAARAGQLPANLFGYFTGMPSYFGVTQQFAFTPQKEKVKSKFCYTGDNGKQVCQ